MKIDTRWTDFSENYSRSSIQDTYKAMGRSVSDFLDSLSPEKYFWKPEVGWSAEQNVKHLWKSTAPVTYSLMLPRFTFLIFGKGGNSRDFHTLVRDYRALLTGSNHAGFFQPFTLTIAENIQIQKAQISGLLRLYNDAVSSLIYWKEEDLDEYRMPHPILGLVTIREMLFFTVYHQYHHFSILSDRLGTIN